MAAAALVLTCAAAWSLVAGLLLYATETREDAAAEGRQGT